MTDLVNAEAFSTRLRCRLREVNRYLKLHGLPPIPAGRVEREYARAAAALRPHITDTVSFLHRMMDKKKDMLFEGAQGTFLDIVHGTYPYVTSSSTTSGGACTGSGVPPNRIDRVVGVMKAYTTRVGGGPLPTEDEALSDCLHQMGREFGAVTGARAALRLVRQRGHQLRGPGQRHGSARGHQPRRSRRPGAFANLRGLSPRWKNDPRAAGRRHGSGALQTGVCRPAWLAQADRSSAALSRPASPGPDVFAEASVLDRSAAEVD